MEEQVREGAMLEAIEADLRECHERWELRGNQFFDYDSGHSRLSPYRGQPNVTLARGRRLLTVCEEALSMQCACSLVMEEGVRDVIVEFSHTGDGNPACCDSNLASALTAKACAIGLLPSCGLGLWYCDVSTAGTVTVRCTTLPVDGGWQKTLDGSWFNGQPVESQSFISDGNLYTFGVMVAPGWTVGLTGNEVRLPWYKERLLWLGRIDVGSGLSVLTIDLLQHVILVGFLAQTDPSTTDDFQVWKSKMDRRKADEKEAEKRRQRVAYRQSQRQWRDYEQSDRTDH